MGWQRCGSLMDTGAKFIIRWSAPDQLSSGKGAVMKSKLSMLKSIAVVAALVAGVSGVARADNDTNPFNGESYLYFKNAQATAGNGAPTFHQSNPNGLSKSELEA